MNFYALSSLKKKKIWIFSFSFSLFSVLITITIIIIYSHHRSIIDISKSARYIVPSSIFLGYKNKIAIFHSKIFYFLWTFPHIRFFSIGLQSGIILCFDSFVFSMNKFALICAVLSSLIVSILKLTLTHFENSIWKLISLGRIVSHWLDYVIVFFSRTQSVSMKLPDEQFAQSIPAKRTTNSTRFFEKFTRNRL